MKMKNDSKRINTIAFFAVLTLLLSSLIMMGCSPEKGVDLHDHSIEIEGKEMKLLTVKEIAELWEIDPDLLLTRMISEFRLQENYSIDTLLEDMRAEYPFSPALVKEIAEKIKTGSEEDE